MPAEGYKSITVSREVYEELKDLAVKTHRSIPKLIEHLIEKIKKKEAENDG